jgi:hypothetical protein
MDDDDESFGEDEVERRSHTDERTEDDYGCILWEPDDDYEEDDSSDSSDSGYSKIAGFDY